MHENDLPPLVVRFAERWNSRDLDGLLALYDEAAEMTDPLLAEPIRGRDALRRYYLEMVFGPYPGARFEVLAGAAEKDEVVLIYRFSEPTASTPWSTLAATSWSIAGGLITHDRAVWDTRRASGAPA
jgi:ketosteroid isomerase-like protein